jgi:asparagine synthase (glutamine-hydrolysing)
MCGIVGTFFPESSADKSELRKMNECLTHRGPDEDGIFCSGSVGFGHRRLSIIDLETGRQPIFNEDSSIVVIFNGEIYNHRSLRKRLADNGHKFETETDTEVLVHLYEEHGIEFINYIEGMFAFALWDEDRQSLLLARDPMGIKPLHVLIDGNSIAFGSEMDAVLKSSLEHGPLNEAAVGEYFAFGYIPAPKSVFENVTKLRPGELLSVDQTGISRKVYYKPNIDSISNNYTSTAQSLRDHVEDAVEKRLMADVPLGAFLSGGIDSSIIVGIISKLVDDPVRTFTIGFAESQFDETWAADAVAEYHNTDHHEYTVTPDDVQDIIPTVVESLGEPFADSSILPTYIVARETQQNATVALSGDGADELFLGYNKYRGEYHSKYFQALPQSVRSNIIKPVINTLPASRKNTSGELVRMAQKFVRGADNDSVSRQYQWMAITTEDTMSALQTVDAIDAGKSRIDSAQTTARSRLPRDRQSPLSVMRMDDTRFALPDGILKKVDRASMLNSLEVRVPFLDTKVFEYAMGLPVEYAITKTDKKRVLKDAFNDILPEEILTRNKQGFEIPVGEWFKNELASEFIGTLDTTDTDLIDQDVVETIYKEHTHGSKDHTDFLWAVYIFLKWFDRMQQNGYI